jgi:membrane-associated phospholipid phosphatase
VYCREQPPEGVDRRDRRDQVRRVRREVIDTVVSRLPRIQGMPEGNPWGSMPSDHVASAAITAMGLAEVGPLYGALGWTYVGLASFAVVYLGEHYTIDVLAGLGIALAVHRGEVGVGPIVYRALLLLDRLAVA